MNEWQPIESAPLDKSVLLWWVSVKPENMYAHSCIIGQVSSYRLGEYWDGFRGKYWDLSLVTHWMPLPEPPTITPQKTQK